MDTQAIKTGEINDEFSLPDFDELTDNWEVLSSPENAFGRAALVADCDPPPPDTVRSPSISGKRSTNKWDPRFILDLAIGVDSLEDILVRYELTEREYNLLSEVPAFRRDLAMAIRDVKTDGVSFEHKARVQAEGYLEEIDNMVFDNATPAGVRLDAIKSVVKWGRLEPKEDNQSSTTNANQINISINF